MKNCDNRHPAGSAGPSAGVLPGGHVAIAPHDRGGFARPGIDGGAPACHADAMRCPLCSARPAKRSCPALAREICPVCCGTKRLVEIRCPADCGYLASSRTHPPATVRRQQDQDLAVLAPALAGFSEARQQLFLFALTLVDRFRGEGLDAASDADAASAAAALAGTYDTASRGLIYEQRPDSIPAQRMADGIKGMFDDARPRPPHRLCRRRGGRAAAGRGQGAGGAARQPGGLPGVPRSRGPHGEASGRARRRACAGRRRAGCRRRPVDHPALGRRAACYHRSLRPGRSGRPCGPGDAR